MKVRAELATSLVIEDVNLAGIRATMVQIDKEIAKVEDALTARERHTEMYEAIKKLKKPCETARNRSRRTRRNFRCRAIFV